MLYSLVENIGRITTFHKGRKNRGKSVTIFYNLNQLGQRCGSDVGRGSWVGGTGPLTHWVTEPVPLSHFSPAAIPFLVRIGSRMFLLGWLLLGAFLQKGTFLFWPLRRFVRVLLRDPRARPL